MSLIFEVIPLIDKFMEKFETIITDSSLHASLRHAARMALQVLNKYYSFTDHCDVYRVSICMFLSPDSFIAKSLMECSTLASKCITSLITNGLKRGSTRR